MQEDKSPANEAGSSDKVQPISESVQLLLWACIGAWVISFFLPAASLDVSGGKPELGYRIAVDAILLLVTPGKLAFVGWVLPPVWTVFLNLFMVLLPVEIKAIKKGEGRGFAVLFAIGAAVPVAMAYFPPQLGLFGLAMPLSIGFYVWSLSMIAAATLLLHTMWQGWWTSTPATVLVTLLICLPIHRGEWNLQPERLGDETSQNGGEWKGGSPMNRTVPPKIPPFTPETFAPVQPKPVRQVNPEDVQQPTVRLESSANPSLSGEPVKFTALITVLRGTVPSGTVSFWFGQRMPQKVRVDGDTAVFTTSELPSGAHDISAAFQADDGQLYLSGRSKAMLQFVNDPKNEATRIEVILVERHLTAQGEIAFTVKLKLTRENERMPAVRGDVVLATARGTHVGQALDENGEATFGDSIPAAMWKGFEMEAYYAGGAGLQASKGRLVLE